MTSFIDANYSKKKSFKHGFLTGLAPWMTKNNVGGGSITTETTNGGRAILSSGTNAQGDRARIDLPKVTPSSQNNFEAIGLRIVFSLNDAAIAGNSIGHFGFLNGNVPARIYHNIIAAADVSSTPSTLRLSNAAGDNEIPVRGRKPKSAIESELLWDTDENKVYHRYGDIFSGVADSANTTVPDPTLDYTSKIQMATWNPTNDRIMYLYEVEVSYYNKNKQ